ncbi:hypothetical protein FORC36_3208 [Vibrio vulnificus]|nr:hypothetical protein FORC9_3198 [Vibrio vulnificus]ANH65076.1 hypothetical protein FORC16_3193 [Vibrio vulnificus]ARN67725.1 hypothetical protein FORC36_3208 [Vibrio vulnificus]ASC58846.1 hypothetical protein FORC37_3152 [Vibrio vulnificus]
MSFGLTMRMRFFYNTIWLGSVTEIRLFSRATVHVCFVKKTHFGQRVSSRYKREK